MVLSLYRIEYFSIDITYFLTPLVGLLESPLDLINMISPRNEVCSNSDNDTDVHDEVGRVGTCTTRTWSWVSTVDRYYYDHGAILVPYNTEH